MYTAYDALLPLFNALAQVGYCRKMSDNETPRSIFIQNIYRTVMWIIIVIYNIQHVIRILQLFHNTEALIATLLIFLMIFAELIKQLIFNVRERRITNAIKTISDYEYIPTDTHDYCEKEMKAYGRLLSRIHKMYIGCGQIANLLWIVYPVVNRAFGKEVLIAAYFPFDTDSSPGFEIVVIYMGVMIGVLAYGNITMECTIPALYAQAEVQFRVLRYSLENFPIKDTNYADWTETYVDRMKFEKVLHERFVKCVKHYERILWYLNEIESIFNEALTIQFLTVTWVLCMTVFKIVGVSFFSAEFIGTALYLVCVLAQSFLYCYYGSQIKHQSEQIINATYFIKWENLTPMFRRKLIIFMERCKQPIEPRTAFVVLLSLETYVSLLRSSYAYYTFLTNK